MNTKDSKTRFSEKGYIIVGICFEANGVKHIEPLKVEEVKGISGTYYNYNPGYIVFTESSVNYDAPTFYEYENRAQSICKNLNEEREKIREAVKKGMEEAGETRFSHYEVRSVRRTFTILD